MEETTNKLLYTIETSGETINNIEATDECIIIAFKGGREITIKHHHEQDCCERVYADFPSLKYHIEEIIKQAEYENILIKGVEGIGFLLCFMAETFYDNNKKIFIPCYDYQNGFYSASLTLNIVDSINHSTKKIDISDLVEHHAG